MTMSANSTHGRRGSSFSIVRRIDGQSWQINFLLSRSSAKKKEKKGKKEKERAARTRISLSINQHFHETMGKCSFRAHTLGKKGGKRKKRRSDTRASILCPFFSFSFFFPTLFLPAFFRNPAGGSTIANGSHFPLSHERDTRRFPSCCSPFFSLCPSRFAYPFLIVCTSVRASRVPHDQTARSLPRLFDTSRAGSLPDPMGFRGKLKRPFVVFIVGPSQFKSRVTFVQSKRRTLTHLRQMLQAFVFKDIHVKNSRFLNYYYYYYSIIIF